MAIFDFLGKKPAKDTSELPPPPPPPSRGLELELPEAPAMPSSMPTQAPLPPPPRPINTPMTLPPMPQTTTSPAPTIPTISGNSAPEEHELTFEMPEHHEEMNDLPPIQELQDQMVMEPTISPPSRIVNGEPIKPMFVSIEDYQDILNSIGQIKETLHETETAMSRLNELKNTQERILEDWRTHVEDAERKITYIDQVIFRGE